MEEVDHESNYEMRDSAMTIEFLRARLLSERSVSKSARRRADELADRVIELEEQLKAVSLQRKKAEKATSDVLSILETFGCSDNSEGFDSSSDQDITHPKTEKSRDIYQQGVESPNYFSRSLSWKSSKCSSHSERKFLSASSRHNSSLSTDSSSHKHHRVGKSCRHVKRKEMRSTVDKLSNNDAISESQISDESKLSRSNHEIKVEEQAAGDADSVCISSLRKLIDSEHQSHQNEGDDGEMERALEHQSELICRYEAEENAQIEWEQKYRENNSSTPESVEPGNQSDVTEERDEMKSQPVSIWPVNEDANSGVNVARVVNEVCASLSNEVKPSRQTTDRPINYQNVDPEVYSQTSHPESGVPMNKTKQIQEKPDTMKPGSAWYHPSSPAGHQCMVSSSQAATSDNYHEGEASKTKPGKTIFVSHKPSKELGSVLEALQQAKLSLQLKLRNVPLPEDRYKGKAVHVRAMSSASRAQVPANCAALYRVPLDLQPDANVYENNLDMRSQSTLMNYYYDSTSAVPANEQFKSTPHAGVGRSHVWDGSSLDVFPSMKKNHLSNQGGGDKYAQRPSILSNRSISHIDHLKFNPQNETQRSTQSPYHDSDFSFLTSDINSSSSQPEYNRSSFREIDLHVQRTFPNRLSSSSSDIQEFNSQRAAAIRSSDSSRIENRRFIRNPQTVSGLRMSSPSQIHGSASSGSQQLFSPESDISDISLPPRARHSYHPSPPTVPDFDPPMPTFSGFPSFPNSPVSDGKHGTGMYRI